MSLILDHLTAILVGSSLIGVLLFVQQRGQQTAIESTIHHSVQTQSFSLTETLSRDLENIRNSEITGVQAHVSREGNNTAALRFITLADPTLGEASPLIAVTYRLEDTGELVEVNDSLSTVFRLARYMNDGSGYVFSGSSTETIVGFNASLLPSDGSTPVEGGTEPDDFGVINVSFTAARPSVAWLAGDQTTSGRSSQTQQGFALRPLPLQVVQSPSSPLPTVSPPDLWAEIPPSPYN